MAHERDDDIPDLSEAELDRLLAGLEGPAPVPPPGLLARIEADALRTQRGFAPRPAPRAPSRRRWLPRLAGRAALPAGLVAAGLVGLWIGVSAGTGSALTGGSVYDSALGLQLIYEFPALAGLLPEG